MRWFRDTLFALMTPVIIVYSSVIIETGFPDEVPTVSEDEDSPDLIVPDGEGGSSVGDK